MCTHSKKRENGVYYFRRVVPKDLRHLFGNAREWTFSLGTKDRREADRLTRLHSVKYDGLIDEARARFAAHASTSRESPANGLQNAGAMSEHELEQMECDAAETAAQEERRELRREHVRQLRERMRLTTAELPPELAAVKELLESDRFDLLLARDRIAVLSAANQDLKREAEQPSNPPINKAGGNSSHAGKRSVAGLITAYSADKQGGWSQSTKAAYAPVFRVLRDVLGEGRDVSTIARDDGRSLFEAVKALPRGLGKLKQLAGLRVPAAIAKGRELGLPTLSPKSINDS